MRLVLAAFLLSLAPATFAQVGISAIDDPLLPDRTPLAEAAEVPPALLLGAPGPSALFLNPARAARADDRFAFGTVRGFGSGAPVAFSGLFGSGDRRWLVSVANTLITQSRSDLDETVRTDPSPPGDGSSTTDLRRLFEQEYAFSNTRARLLLVGCTDFGGYAFGLFGGFRTQRTHFLRNEDFSQAVRLTTPDETLRRDRHDTQESVQRYDEDDLAVGAEVALAGRTWDLAASVSYQRRAADAVAMDDRESVHDETRTLFGSTTERLDASARSYEQRLDATPSAVGFDVVGTLGAGLSRSDYLFAHVAGAVGGGTADYSSASTTSTRSFLAEDGQVLFDLMNGSRLGPERGAANLDGRLVTATLGYVYSNRAPRRDRHRGRRDRDGLTVLAGVLPSVTHRRTEAVRPTGEEALLLLDEGEATGLALDLPLYARYPVTERFDLFGGGVLSYSYTRRASSSSPLLPDDPATGQDLRTRETESEAVASGGRVYAGAVFTARSGFTAQAAFRGDLANITGWTVSLGYRF